MVGRNIRLLRSDAKWVGVFRQGCTDRRAGDGQGLNAVTDPSTPAMAQTIDRRLITCRISLPKTTQLSMTKILIV
jgi:hypothetical protein